MPELHRKKINLLGKESGMTLVEILVALAILGITAVTFLGAAATGSKAVIIIQERVTAESVAKSVLEYIKSSAYDDAAPLEYSIGENVTIPAGYSIIDPVPAVAIDTGLQKVTVTVKKGDKTLLTMADYKVNR